MPKLVDPDQKRNEFVRASWQVIANEGLKGATLRRVAAEAGCTTGALTHYFPDRRALLVDALRSAHFQAGARMLSASREAESDLERLRMVVLEALPIDEARLVEWRVWLAFWAESMNDVELADENARRYEEWKGLLVELLTPLLSRETDVDEEATYLIALIDGLGLRIAREASSPTRLETDFESCRITIERYLAGFEST